MSRGGPTGRSFTLSPLVTSGALEPGPFISCSVGGLSFTAELGSDGSIIFEGYIFKSPSAFSVYVKRKQNPSRKADDGWTSCKYKGQLLSLFRPQLEALVASGVVGPAPGAGGGATARTASGRGGGGGGGPPRPRPSAGGRAVPPGATPVLRTFDSDFGEYDSDGGGGSVGGGGRRGGAPSASGRRTPGGGSAANGGWPSPSARRNGASGANSARRGRPPKARPAGSGARGGGGGGLLDDDGGGGGGGGGGGSLVLLTWIQCEEPECGKWRRLRAADVPDGPWTCAMHPDPEWASCSIPQAVPDDEIDRQLDAGVGLPHNEPAHPAASAGAVSPAAAAHAASCRRPALTACSTVDFEADLCAFLTANGEADLVRALRTKRITCNNSPLDVFGLYRAVIDVGGFDRNERYDEAGRWAGGINFAGAVFPRMANYTPSHRATSVGNQLLANYRKFLLAYERAHAGVDLAGWPPFTRTPGGGGPTASGRAKKPRPDPLAFLADVASAGEPPAPDGLLARQAASAPPGAVAAAAAAAAARAGAPAAHAAGAGTGGAGAVTSAYGLKRATEDDGASAPPSLFKRPRGPVDGPLPPPPGDARAAPTTPAQPAGLLSRQRSGLDAAAPPVSLEAALANVDALRRLEGGPGRVPAGALLLAPDPEDLNRHWPVVVAAARDLPLAVAGGGAVRPPHFRAAFPPTLAEAVGGSPGGPGARAGSAAAAAPALGDAYPVVVAGGRAMGWVEAASCRPFTGSAAAAAAAAVSPHVARRLAPVVADSDGGAGGGVADETAGPAPSAAVGGCPHADADAECGRALKVASQYARSASGAEAGPAGRAGGRAMAHSAGTAAVAARLAALEARLPADGAVFSGAYEFWAAWRRAVGRAEAAADLVPHTLALAAQLRPAALLPGRAADALLAEVRSLLDVTPPPGSPPGVGGGGGGGGGAAAPAGPAAAAAAAAAASLAAATTADAGGPCTSATGGGAAPAPPGSPTSGGGGTGPSGGAAGAGGVPAVEAAVAALEGAVDWARLARAGPAGAGPGGGLVAATPPRPPTARSPLPPGALGAAGGAGRDLRHSGSATNLAAGGGLLGAACSPAGPGPAGAPARGGGGGGPLAARAGSSSLPPVASPRPAPLAPGGGAAAAAAAAAAVAAGAAGEGPSTPVERGGGGGEAGGSESPTAGAAAAGTPPAQLAPGTAAQVAKLFGDGAPAAAAAAAVAAAAASGRAAAPGAGGGGAVPATTPPQPRNEPLPVKAGGAGGAVNDTVSVGSADTARAAAAAAAAAGGRAELLESLRSMAESERAQ